MPLCRHCFGSWTAWILWGAFLVTPVVGQTPVTQLPSPLPTEIPTSPLAILEQSLIPDPQGVVVLQDGRSFSGAVREVPGGYRVQTGATFNILPFDQVLVTGETLSQAYAALRDSVPIHTVESHLKLAGWCRDQGLLPEAKLEIAAALKQEPLRSDARQLLKELEGLTNPQPIHRTVESVPAMTADGFTKPEERTAQGVSRETMQEYIRRVQPLVMNKCGNAHCHGEAAGREFSIVMNRSASNQSLLSERNLTSLLQQVTLATPEMSPLLLKPQAATDVHRHVFSGSTGARQRQILEDWIQRLAEDKGVPRAPTAPAQSPHVQLAAATMAATVSQPNQQSTTDPQQFLEGILRDERPDQFDPDLFNRRMHGRTAAELRTTSLSPEATPALQPASRIPGITPQSLLTP